MHGDAGIWLSGVFLCAKTWGWCWRGGMNLLNEKIVRNPKKKHQLMSRIK